MADEIDALLARQRAAATRLTEVFMDEVLGEAQRLAPIEEGTLRGSADRETTHTANGVQVEGRFTTVYAARQHEELDWNHPRGGQAKYLEEPFKRRAHTYEAKLARAVAAVTR